MEICIGDKLMDVNLYLINGCKYSPMANKFLNVTLTKFLRLYKPMTTELRLLKFFKHQLLSITLKVLEIQ
jgi:hypothetical protein